MADSRKALNCVMLTKGIDMKILDYIVLTEGNPKAASTLIFAVECESPRTISVQQPMVLRIDHVVRRRCRRAECTAARTFCRRLCYELLNPWAHHRESIGKMVEKKSRCFLCTDGYLLIIVAQDHDERSTPCVEVHPERYAVPSITIDRTPQIDRNNSSIDLGSETNSRPYLKLKHPGVPSQHKSSQ